MIKVNNLGRNRTELKTDCMIIFFSYQTPVAAEVNGKFYKTKEKHSITTSRHVDEWLKGVNAEKKEQSFFNNLIA